MVSETLVKEIVGTYSLPQKLEDKIIRIATRRIDELCISGFDSTYRYIDQLIEKFRVPFWNRLPVSLDRKISFDSRGTFHDILGTEDLTLSKLAGNQELYLVMASSL